MLDHALHTRAAGGRTASDTLALRRQPNAGASASAETQTCGRLTHIRTDHRCGLRNWQGILAGQAAKGDYCQITITAEQGAHPAGRRPRITP